MLSPTRKSVLERGLETVHLKRKSALDRALDTMSDSLDAIGDATPRLPDVASGKARKAGLIAVGGLAGLTAASAAISSLRRRIDGAGDDS